MNISKSHKRFSERFRDRRVLTNPEKFLGPNYKAVLNFWMILDDLSKDQWEVIVCRYRNFRDYQPSDWKKATDEAWDASREAIRDEFAYNASYAALDVYGYIAGWATYELIGMHKILEHQKPLTFFQMFLEVL